MEAIVSAALKTTESSPPKPELVAEIAKGLEAAFLSEVLGFVGLNGSEGSFGGGIGEDQFQSFLRESYAKSIVSNGGIGLAEHFARSLKEE